MEVREKRLLFWTSVGLILVVGGLLAWKFWYLPYTYSKINSFTDCAKKYPVMLSYPAQCNTPDGKHFVDTVLPIEYPYSPVN